MAIVFIIVLFAVNCSKSEAPTPIPQPPIDTVVTLPPADTSHPVEEIIYHNDSIYGVVVARTSPEMEIAGIPGKAAIMSLNGSEVEVKFILNGDVTVDTTSPYVDRFHILNFAPDKKAQTTADTANYAYVRLIKHSGNKTDIYNLFFKFLYANVEIGFDKSWHMTTQKQLEDYDVKVDILKSTF